MLCFELHLRDYDRFDELSIMDGVYQRTAHFPARSSARSLGSAP